ncbi:MAG: phosphoribosyltransferase [Nitrososphaerota archaeon]
MYFEDRIDAGEKLAIEIERQVGRPSLVLGIPRGGVIVGYVIAKKLHAELDVIVARKIGVPGNPELAVAAVAEGGELAIEEEVANIYGVSYEYIESQARKEVEEINRRLEKFRDKKRILEIKDKEVIVVDDGLATGTTMIAALKSVRKKLPKRLIAAAPVASKEAVGRVRTIADDVVVLYVPEDFYAIGEFYRDFSQVSDEEVIRYLASIRGGDS